VTSNPQNLAARKRADLIDSLDEELEMELDDARLERLIEVGGEGAGDLDRAFYFKELFRLQGELVSCRIMWSPIS